MADSVTLTATSPMVGTGLVVTYSQRQRLQLWRRALVSTLFGLISGLWASSASAAVATDSAEGVSGKKSALPPIAASADYPVDTAPPKDFFDDRLLRTLAREASATVVCQLLGLVDVFP